MARVANPIGVVGGRRFGAAPRSPGDIGIPDVGRCTPRCCPEGNCPTCEARRACMAAHPAGSSRSGTTSKPEEMPVGAPLTVSQGRAGRERGMVTAELAAAIPASAFVAVLLAWVLSLGVAQGQVQAAARDGARAAARGDNPGQVASAVARVAPGAAVRVSRRGRLVQVQVSQLRSPPGAALAGLARTLRATAVAEVEPS